MMMKYIWQYFSYFNSVKRTLCYEHFNIGDIDICIYICSKRNEGTYILRTFSESKYSIYYYYYIYYIELYPSTSWSKREMPRI